MGKQLLPPEDFDRRHLPMASVDAQSLMRIHWYDKDPLYFGITGWHRFDDPKKEYGVMYAAMHLVTCLAETLLRDFFQNAQDVRSILTHEDLASRYISTFTMPEGMKLQLADLTGASLHKLGGDARVTASTEYASCSQRWSRAVWQHPSDVHGLLFMSRYINTNPAVALFDRVIETGFRVNRTVPLADHADLSTVLKSYEIGL